MANEDIIAIGRSNPFLEGVSTIAQGVSAFGAGLRRREEEQRQSKKMQSRNNAYKSVVKGFLDTSDRDATNAHLLEGIEHDAETAFAAINLAGGLNPKQSKDLFDRLTEGLPPEEKADAIAIKLGLKPRAVGSSEITIAEGGKTQTIADSQAEIARKKKEGEAIGKAEGEAKSASLIASTKSSIASAIQQEKDRAKSEGEKSSQLKLSYAALPSLRSVVSELKSLAPIATNTFSGKIFNATAKELGFSGTEGGTARAKFVSIVDNQILPLLKQTFGSAFTAKEGETLKATLGDPDASADEKIAQLESFMESKIREIEVLERQITQEASSEAPLQNSKGWGLQVDAAGNRAYVGPSGEIEEVE